MLESNSPIKKLKLGKQQQETIDTTELKTVLNTIAMLTQHSFKSRSVEPTTQSFKQVIYYIKYFRIIFLLVINVSRNSRTGGNYI